MSLQVSNSRPLKQVLGQLMSSLFNPSICPGELWFETWETCTSLSMIENSVSKWCMNYHEESRLKRDSDHDPYNKKIDQMISSLFNQSICPEYLGFKTWKDMYSTVRTGDFYE